MIHDQWSMTTHMDNCIFCKIAAGEIPCYKVFENEKFLAFLDIKPLSQGHTLVIPKEHFRWVWDVTNLGEYYEVVGKVAKALKVALNTEYVCSFVFGEDVPHAHVWLVPSNGLGNQIDFSKRQELTTEEAQTLLEKIKNNLN